jgi:large subunit ribosomal protein L46
MRPYSVALATAPIDTSNRLPTASPPPHSSTKNEYRIKSGIILSRPPLLTRKLTDFENAFFFYQKRLNERLSQPFITNVYFKPDTSPMLDWNLKVKDRKGTVAKELGQYHGKQRRAWDDEVKVGDSISSQENIQNVLLKDAEMRISEDAEEIAEEDRVPVEQPLPRESEADRTGDLRRLDRKLDRTLYLVVKDDHGAWGFPNTTVPTDENLHEVSQTQRLIPWPGEVC